jgi:hypothetical protein
MKIEIINSKDSTVDIDKYPDKCPFCHKSIHPIEINAYYSNSNRHGKKLEVTFLCPSMDCKRIFISYYIWSNNYGGVDNFYLHCNMFGNLEPIEFKDIIRDISPDYCTIYEEAYAAEQFGLKQICGIGYRKALEFLIKDYLIKVKSKANDIIKNKYLGNCIKEDIENHKIKNVAKRAVWLGNDEGHYYRKWEDKDLTDLKNLITLTVNWIEDEAITEKYTNEMSEE